MGWRTLVIVGGLVLCTATARAQENAASPDAAEEPLARFEQVRDEWSSFSQELDKALFRMNQLRANRAAPERLQQAIHIYDDVLERGAEVMTRLIDATLEAYRDDPDNAEAQRLLEVLADTCLASDRYEDAARMARALVDQGVEGPEPYRWLGLASLELMQLDLAEECFRRVESRGGTDEKIQAAWDRLERMREPWAKEQAVREAEAAADNLPRVLLRTTRGDIVVELYEDQAPNTVAQFISLVEDQFYNGLEFFRVETHFAAVTGCPANNGTRGSGFQILNEFDREDRRMAVRGTLSMVDQHGQGTLGSQFFIALSNFGALDAVAKNTVFGRVIEGMEVVEALRRVNPSTTDAEFMRDRIESAEVLRKRNHAYQPVTTFDLARAKEEEAIELIRAKDFEAARLALEEGVRIAPLAFNLRYRLGLLHLQQENAAEAIAELTRASRRAPNNPDVHFYLATAYGRNGDTVGAIKHFEKVLSLRPDDINAHKNLGVLFYSQRRWKRAVEHLQEAVRLDPNDADAKQYLVRAEAAQQ